MSNVDKKKILFVITKGSPFGGAQRYVYDLATNVPEEFEVTVACGPNSAKAPLGKEGLTGMLEEKGIRTITLENSEREINLKKDFKTIKELIKIIKEEKPNIVHLNSSKIGFLGALAVLFTRISHFVFRISPSPLSIFTAHGWAFNERNRSQFSRFIFYIAHYFTVLFCNATIAVSEKAKKDIAWLPFMKDKIKVIYNGIGKFKLKSKKEAREILLGEDLLTHSISTQGGEQGRTTSSWQARKIIILSISELHHNKGLDIALKAIAKLPKNLREKIIYCIAGAGEEKSNLEQLANGMGISRNVKFLGFMPNVKELLSGADIFLLPSRTEALPYCLLEAGAAGAPIVAASVGGVPEIINDMQDGILVHPRDPREVAEAISYLMENPDKKKMFKEKIKETVTLKFTAERMIHHTYSLYKSLLSNT